MSIFRALMIGCLGALALSGAPRVMSGSLGTTLNPATTLEPAAGMFLVAQRDLHDPFFGKTVILLLSHDSDGSLGLIVNRQFQLRLSDALPEFDDAEAKKHPLYFGGPVGMHQVFMLMRNAPSSPLTRHVAGDIYFSADRQVLEEMLARKTPGSELHLYFGYAGWTAGQLAAELGRGSWHLVEGSSEAIFDGSSHELWGRLIEKLEPSGIEVRINSGHDLQAAVATGR